MLLPGITLLITNCLICWKLKRLTVVGRTSLMKTYKTLGLTLAAFYTCWTPVTVATITYVMGYHNWTLNHILIEIMSMQSCLSLPIYIYSNTEFRKAFLGLMRGKNRVGVTTR